MALAIDTVELIDVGCVVDPYISKVRAKEIFGVSDNRTFSKRLELFFELIEDGFYDSIVVSSDCEIFNYFALKHYQIHKDLLKEKTTRKYAPKFDKKFIEKLKSMM